jgi:DNA-binding NarL/FixJ family response regulator
VRNYVQSVLTKLNAHSKLEAVSTAVREGIIDYPMGT